MRLNAKNQKVDLKNGKIVRYLQSEFYGDATRYIVQDMVTKDVYWIMGSEVVGHEAPPHPSAPEPSQSKQPDLFSVLADGIFAALGISSKKKK
jgi:hypothetical protein